jgi:hypothetical protein
MKLNYQGGTMTQDEQRIQRVIEYADGTRRSRSYEGGLADYGYADILAAYRACPLDNREARITLYRELEVRYECKLRNPKLGTRNA